MNKAEATTMLLMSEFGERRHVDSKSRLHALVLHWASATPFWIAGCGTWLDESVRYVDRIGQDWSWVREPHVMFCSQDCAAAEMYVSKECMHICDCCGEHNGELFVVQLQEILLLTSCCRVCAGLPEAFAHLN